MIGTSWSSTSWRDNAWANNTWAGDNPWADKLYLMVPTQDDIVYLRKLTEDAVVTAGHTFDHIHLTPASTVLGPEGTMFYCSDDNAIWVATE
jgi:hypothetical protein